MAAPDKWQKRHSLLRHEAFAFYTIFEFEKKGLNLLFQLHGLAQISAAI